MVEAVHIPMDCTAVALPALTSPWPCQHLTHWEQWLKSVVWIGTIFSFIAVTFARDKCYSNGSHKLLQLWVVLFSVCLVWLVCLFVCFPVATICCKNNYEVGVLWCVSSWCITVKDMALKGGFRMVL